MKIKPQNIPAFAKVLNRKHLFFNVTIAYTLTLEYIYEKKHIYFDNNWFAIM
jgi:hypothetical protein